jgi:hypothetical protein
LKKPAALWTRDCPQITVEGGSNESCDHRSKAFAKVSFEGFARRIDCGGEMTADAGIAAQTGFVNLGNLEMLVGAVLQMSVGIFYQIECWPTHIRCPVYNLIEFIYSQVNNGGLGIASGRKFSV